MFVAALIILLVGVLLLVAAVLGGGASATLDLGVFKLDTNAAGVFFLGMATLLLLGLGVAMLRIAARRARARRGERRQLGELSDKLDAYRREDRDTDRQPGRDDGEAQPRG